LAIANSGDAADQLLLQAGHLQPLAIGLPIDLHVAMARAKSSARAQPTIRGISPPWRARISREEAIKIAAIQASLYCKCDQFGTRKLENYDKSPKRSRELIQTIKAL
jgi:hypothetical protein